MAISIKPAYISSSSYIKNKNDNSLTISGLSFEEMELLEAGLRGINWFKFTEGRLNTSPSHQPLPEPTIDGLMTPQWLGDVKTDLLGYPDLSKWKNVKVVGKDKTTEHSSPSIIIQHIDAGYFSKRTQDTYLDCAKRLESYGFECMRSRRGRNGQFWELWFLPGLWCAEGDLKAAICEGKGLKALENALSFLRTCRVQFATLDICVQRLAIAVDD